MRIRQIALVLGALAAMSWAAPAYATTYGSAYSPIKISSDGNGWFYGSITVHNHSSLLNSYHYKDTSGDGNAVYVQTNWSFWAVCGNDGTSCWDPDPGSDQSPRIGTADGVVASSDSDALDGRADRGRGTTKVCEDQSFSPDPCSSKVIITLSY